MTIRKLIILSLVIFLLPLTVGGQKKKRVVKKAAPVVVEEPEEDPRITNMREMTQQIIIIDSIVTDKDRFLSCFQLSPETGRLSTSEAFFNKPSDGYVFLNEMGNKIYFSQADKDGRQQLYTCDKLGNAWSAPTPLAGIDEGIIEASYPFMLTDGITFYFAAKGEESIGGYDIFLTRYDSHSGGFFKPENIGMPFNSEANDYMYAIDEANNIGYFVSDRRQPEGKVCVYIFIPSDSRKVYDAGQYTEEQIRDFADISRIADTWGNGVERKAALERLKNIQAQYWATAPNAQAATDDMVIVINDRLTYANAREFRSAEASALYKELITVRHNLSILETEMVKSREQYSEANTAKRQALRKEILAAEDKSLKLSEQAKSLEKRIRKLENEAL